MSGFPKKKICPFFQQDLCLLGSDCMLLHRLADGYDDSGDLENPTENCSERNAADSGGELPEKYPAAAAAISCAPPTPPTSEDDLAQGSPTRFSTPNSTFSANSTIEALGVLSKSKLNPEAPDFLPSSRKMDQNNRRKWTKPELKREIAGLRESLEMVLVPTFNQPPPGLMSVPPPSATACTYCKNPGHPMKSADGRVTCPSLWLLVCERCGATGPVAHTPDRCPNTPKEPKQCWEGCQTGAVDVRGHPGRGTGVWKRSVVHYPDDWQVFVEQLPQSCTEDDLRVLFGSYGTVEGVRIYRFTDDLLSPLGTSCPRHAFVLFNKVSSVQRLLAHVEKGHEIVLRDRRLKVRQCTMTMVLKRAQISCAHNGAGALENDDDCPP